MRLGVALGAKRETFMGLAGLGDLVLTCTDDQSRNGASVCCSQRGRRRSAALTEIGQVVEGYTAAKAVRTVASRSAVRDAALRRCLSRALRGGSGQGRGS